LVFRESAGKSVHPSALLLRDLERLIRQIPSTQREQQKMLLTNALLRAGEIECALADLSDYAAPSAADLTNALATALVRSERTALAPAFATLTSSALPDTLNGRAPEGFAYYALDPLSYVGKIRELSVGRAAVVGIRSIGTVLSAVVASELRCERLTVRPTGHPYDRELRLTPEQLKWLYRHRHEPFVVVDEGPGLSGSSFLAVAEALENAGISRARIVLIGSNAVDPTRLVARDAAVRWSRFRYDHVDRNAIPPDARPFHGWDWRRELLPNDHVWPASWQQMTPPKFIANDGHSILKFEGLGRAGDAVRERANALSGAGLGPRVLGEREGFTHYEFVTGQPLSSEDLDDTALRRLVDYITFRSENFRSEVRDASSLDEMTLHNVAQLLGVELGDFRLAVEQPTIPDARLMPHEWLRTDDGRLIKADGVMHGDDHFFPGPCDLAWDLAGAIIEWKMDASTAELFIAICERKLAKNVRLRIDAYSLAYCSFHAAYAKMACNALSGTEETQRFALDFDRYVALMRPLAEKFALKPASLSA
jgi:hypothetical protein